MSPAIQEFVPLAPLTTLELGGPARFFADADDEGDLLSALRWANGRGLTTFVLGGGSNLVIADEGFSGLVLRPRLRGLSVARSGVELRITAQAGETWDDVVAEAVRQDAAGIECLSGIPGLVGAAPVQNIGAYGQEVAEVIESVHVLDRQRLQATELRRAACHFGYRDSLFRRMPERSIILGLTLKLTVGTRPALRYSELEAAFADRPTPGLAEVRAKVLDLRRKKSMLYDVSDANRRSAGSFFTNPILDGAEANRVAERAVRGGLVRQLAEVPRFTLPDGRVKLAAGWLIEHAGICKGLRMGSVGISSRHALALVHHGGGTTADLIRLAVKVRDTVRERFGVVLSPEPILLGMTWPA